MTDPITSTQFCEQHPFGTHTACPACADARTAAMNIEDLSEITA